MVSEPGVSFDTASLQARECGRSKGRRRDICGLLWAVQIIMWYFPRGIEIYGLGKRGLKGVRLVAIICVGCFCQESMKPREKSKQRVWDDIVAMTEKKQDSSTRDWILIIGSFASD